MDLNISLHLVTQGNDSYIWSDGWPVFFTEWGPGEPSNIPDEGCVSMHASRAFHGTWNDTKCSLAKPYICKTTSGGEHTHTHTDLVSLFHLPHAEALLIV